MPSIGLFSRIRFEMAQTISSYLGVSEEKLESTGVLDTVLGVDTHLFLDPWLLQNTTIPEFKNSYEKIKSHFSAIVTLLSSSSGESDRAWREAHKRLIFRELSGVSIGYGVHSSDGSAIGPKLALRLCRSALEIVRMGIKDPEVFELLGLFEEDFGADRLSDMSISIIKEDVYHFTQRVSSELKLKNLHKFDYNGTAIYLPRHPSKNKPLIFLPKVFLRDLPIALTSEGIDYVVSVNQELRNRLNNLIGLSWKEKIKKKELRDLIFSDKKNIEYLLMAYKQSKQGQYDFENDPAGEVKWYRTGKKFAEENPIKVEYKKLQSIDDLESVVSQIVSQFKKNIEVNGLKEHLYIKKGFKNMPRHERYSQLLFYSTADSYCNANDLDINREPNAGSGAVDFKFSRGYKARMLVEIKLSSHSRLIHGFEKQLPAYGESESTKRCLYVVIQVTESNRQIKNLQKYREQLLKEGIAVPLIIVIDGRVRSSASKR